MKQKIKTVLNIFYIIIMLSAPIIWFSTENDNCVSLLDLVCFIIFFADIMIILFCLVLLNQWAYSKENISLKEHINRELNNINNAFKL